MVPFSHGERPPASYLKVYHVKPKTGSGADGAKVNRLLAALSRPDWSRWQAELEPIDLPLGHVLYEPGGKIDFMTFPTTAIVSMLYVMENGASAEIAVVGYEGLVGISIFMGGESMPSRAVVQSRPCNVRREAPAGPVRVFQSRPRR